MPDGYETVTPWDLLGYARVSATDQQPQLQVDALERAGCYRVFAEIGSGARSDRPNARAARPRRLLRRRRRRPSPRPRQQGLIMTDGPEQVSCRRVVPGGAEGI